MPLQPGTTIGPYTVTAKIGEGGMGEVWQARDTKLDRGCAEHGGGQRSGRPEIRRESACVAHGCDFSRGILPFTMSGAVQPRVA